METIRLDLQRRCLQQMINYGLLDKVMPEKLEISKGVIIVPCSDGDQFDDTYKHVARMCAMPRNRIHPVALNGGAILMSNVLAEDQRLDGERMLKNVIIASELKKINDVFLYTHFPCAVARLNGIGVVDQGNYLLLAKKRLREAAPNLRIRCFFHTDMPDEIEDGERRKRTYFVPKEKWDESKGLILQILHDYKEML